LTLYDDGTKPETLLPVYIVNYDSSFTDSCGNAAYSKLCYEKQNDHFLIAVIQTYYLRFNSDLILKIFFWNCIENAEKMQNIEKHSKQFTDISRNNYFGISFHHVLFTLKS